MNFGNLKNNLGKLKNLAPSNNVLDILKEVFDATTLAEIKQGKVVVTDKTLNDIAAKQIAKVNDLPIKSFELVSHADQKLEIKTVLPKIGNVSLIGKIEDFHIGKDSAVLVYDVENYKITDIKILSWIFSQISLGLLYRFIGNMGELEGVNIAIDGDKISADISKLLATSKLNKTIIGDITALDVIEIENATPKEGGIELSVKLNAVNIARDKLKSLIN